MTTKPHRVLYLHYCHLCGAKYIRTQQNVEKIVYISTGSGIGLGTSGLDETDNFELHLWFIMFIVYPRNEISNRR